MGITATPVHESPQARVQHHARPFVVLAEDDDEVRETLGEAFEADGFRVVAVTDGEQLAEVLDSCHRRGDLPDVVVTDHRMPAYTGLEVLEALKETGWPVPVIVLTAFGGEVRSLAEACGALAVFDKPFDLDELRTGVFWAVDWRRHPRWYGERTRPAAPAAPARRGVVERVRKTTPV